MLSRVARQKNALFHLRKANARWAMGTLPILRLHSTRTPAVASQNNLTAEPRRRPSFQSHRHLATAADPATFEQSSYMSLDDASLQPSIDGSSVFDKPNQLLPPIDLIPSLDRSSLIILDETPQTQPTVIRRVRGIGGDEEEILANFEMSLRVARFDQAAALITRLGSFYSVSSPEYLAFHNHYLDAMVTHMIITRQPEMVRPLQKWFETDMPGGGVKPDATTFAIMIRMALRMLYGPTRDRAVRRYWHLAKADGLHEDLLRVEVLSDLELGELSKICFADLRQATFDMMGLKDPEAENLPKHTDNVAEALPVDLKGLGLKSLKDSMALFTDSSQISLPPGLEGTNAQKREFRSILKQRRLEADTVKAASDLWRAEFEKRRKSGANMLNGAKLGPVISEWHASLVSKIKEELKLADEDQGKPIRTREQKARCEYSILLQCLDADRLAALTILSVISTFSKTGMEKGVKLSAAASGIGRDVQDELIAESCLKRSKVADPRRFTRLKEFLAGRKTKESRIPWYSMSKTAQAEDPSLDWSPRVSVRLGAVLMSFLFEVAKVPAKAKDFETGETTASLQPAFQHTYQMSFGKRQGLIHMRPELVKIVAKEPPAELVGRHLPMVSKPKPWTAHNDGGYLIYKSKIVRTTPGEVLQPAYIKAALADGGLKEVRAGLDVLGQTGWVVNRDVLNVMLEAWNSGEAIANLAPIEPGLQNPPKPDRDAGYEAEKDWQARVRDLENLRSGFHSVRCFQNFQLEVARTFRNETFYLPHNMDFRGRAYPLPPYLNQMGADNARGLLLFSEAKPLGVSGMRWLKIQIANLAGFDKASMSEREQFAMDNLDNIIDSADNGLHGKRWWLKAEDPWQCLAACCELRNALRLPNPTEYLSRLPIHQDGSCNGLQHYAALGGDSIGAQQVNLEPSDRPSDVYTGVSEFVKQAVSDDAAKGDEFGKIFDGKITRKIVKQTVMTNVYGVTFLGAIRQVRKQILDHYPDLSPEAKRYGSIYIARKIFEALGSMFNGAHAIQYWLGDCANRITQSLSPSQIQEIASQALTPAGTRHLVDPSKSFRTTVIWTTPLGLPVVQPYRTRKARRIETTMQDISIVDASSDDVVSRRKQLQAFPPNFIHSLDATHMILSANACKKAGLTFSAVHDSFWTHAGDVDSMNRILRDAFVSMHSDDVIGRLAAEFNTRFGKHLYLAKIDVNSNIGRAIRNYRKGLSNKTKSVELLNEHRRQTLLRSEDPEGQAEGRAMVTAASIFEAMGGSDNDLALSSTLGANSVGHVPEDLTAAERAPANVVDTSDPAIHSLFTDIDMMDVNTAASDGAVNNDVADPSQEPVIDEMAPSKRRKQVQQRSLIWLWLPLRFRDVPTKGAWDLTRIRDSEYFFS
ncbi:uncharacterized protein N7459_002907 [Penicillium hispanicum]|uniref:uncharacterized protein n=1 Tax=Penicillium hispanicum TaxID=1080232 RepID=UPI0025406632|nr:uncharacterized protein N7459_002907 [Penicillium hispanicum]KAJ5587142.1 hypothetical protein N7459_002907 [Penicillium hispanicum]